MPTLEMLADRILNDNPSDEEWLQIEELVNEAIKNASEDELLQFINSGAKDRLLTTLEYMG